MAGNGKTTVVSLKRHEALKKGFAELSKQISEYESQIKDLNEKVRLLESVSFLRHELNWFARRMEASLLYHDPVKGDSYRKAPLNFFLSRIAHKMRDLSDAASVQSSARPARILHHAVAVANYCMMIGINAAVEGQEYKFD